VRINTASGDSSGVVGRVSVPTHVAFSLGMAQETHIPLSLFVIEGSDPPIFELLLSAGVLRSVGAYVDPLHEVLVFRPRWQSHADLDTFSLLPVSIAADHHTTAALATVMVTSVDASTAGEWFSPDRSPHVMETVQERMGDNPMSPEEFLTRLNNGTLL